MTVATALAVCEEWVSGVSIDCRCVLPILVACFVGVLLAFARETELFPSGVTLSLLRNVVVSLTMCCALCLYFGVPFPSGMNFEINWSRRRAAWESRGNDRDASTLIASTNQRVHNFQDRAHFPGACCPPNFVLCCGFQPINFGHYLCTRFPACVARAAGLSLVYIRGVKLRLSHSKASSS